MSLATAAFVLLAALVTATVPGVLGMAGGLLLMGALLLVLPAALAFVVHGLLQLVSNGWRALLHRRHIQWRVIAYYAVGSVVAAATLALVAYVPDKQITYLLLGLVPGLVWLPRSWLALDVTRPPQAVLAGLLTALSGTGTSVPWAVLLLADALGRHRDRRGLPGAGHAA